MTLLELCEPLFQYVCTLNRAARKGAPQNYSTVRARLNDLLFEELPKRAAEAELGREYDGVQLVLIYFADSMVVESSLEFARRWDQERLAFKLNKLAGDEDFFDLLDETLGDSSEEAAERLTVFYACMGLGFSGFYSGQKDYLAKKMMEIASRIRGHMDVDERARICPEAYEHVDTRNLVEPPGRKLVGIVIALVVFGLALVTANIFVFSQTSEDLVKALEAIRARRPSAVQTVPETRSESTGPTEKD